VVGIIEGSDSVLKQEYIIIGVHYDHLGFQIKNGKILIFNGADDNASGTAALNELARALKAEEKNLKEVWFW
jgi:Zn-dependent M28 family amino/carboxypeptidase